MSIKMIYSRDLNLPPVTEDAIRRFVSRGRSFRAEPLQEILCQVRLVADLKRDPNGRMPPSEVVVDTGNDDLLLVPANFGPSLMNLPPLHIQYQSAPKMKEIRKLVHLGQGAQHRQLIYALPEIVDHAATMPTVMLVVVNFTVPEPPRALAHIS